MLRIGVLVSGGGTNLQAMIDEIHTGRLNAEIVLVVSSKPGVYALERAKAAGIQGLAVSRKACGGDSEYAARLISLFSEKSADIIVTAGFLSILPLDFLEFYKNKIINIHPSLIPAFCGRGMYGLHVHEAALKCGVKVTGATVHFVSEVIDGGAIILQKAVDVLDDDTPESLQLRVMEQAERIILPEALRLFSQNKIVIENGRTRRLP